MHLATLGTSVIGNGIPTNQSSWLRVMVPQLCEQQKHGNHMTANSLHTTSICLRGVASWKAARFFLMSLKVVISFCSELSFHSNILKISFRGIPSSDSGEGATTYRMTPSCFRLISIFAVFEWTLGLINISSSSVATSRCYFFIGFDGLGQVGAMSRLNEAKRKKQRDDTGWSQHQQTIKSSPFVF